MRTRKAHSTFMIVAAMFPICAANAAFGDQTVLGAMQSFQEFCLSANLSIEAIANAAEARHYELVVNRRLPGPAESTIVNKTWKVIDSTGNFALTVTQEEGSSSGRTFQCGVTLPKGTENGVESALTDPSHFGVPDHVDVNVDGTKVVRWLKHFEWGTAEVGLASRLPTLQGASMINVVYRLKP